MSYTDNTPTNFRNLIELSDFFKDETVCRKYLEKLLWNGTPVCPHCGVVGAYRFSDGRRFKCSDKECRKQFTVTVGTFFESSKVPLRKWFHALYIFSSHKKGVSSHQLAKDIGVTQKTAWFILSRLRSVFADNDTTPLSGSFEIDETYVGGAEKNKHQSRKAKNRRRELAGLSHNSKPPVYTDKTMVFGIAQRGGIIRNFVVEKAKGNVLIPIIQKNITEGSAMYSDDFHSYKPLKKHGYNHESVQHSYFEYVRGDVHTSNLDGYWSSLKRGIFGIYHKASRKHLHRYCNEFVFRYNTRKLNERQRFEKAISQCVGRLKYSELIAD